MLPLIFQTSDVVTCNNNEEVAAQPIVAAKQRSNSKDQRQTRWRRVARNVDRLLFISYIIVEVALVVAYLQITN